MKNILSERKLQAFGIVIAEDSIIENCALRRVVFVSQSRSKSGGAGRMTSHDPVAEVKVVNRLLHKMTAGFRNVKVSITGRSVMPDV